MPHDHAASERRRQEDEATANLNSISKLRSELIVTEGALRTIAANPISSHTSNSDLAKSALFALERMRK